MWDPIADSSSKVISSCRQCCVQDLQLSTLRILYWVTMLHEIGDMAQRRLQPQLHAGTRLTIRYSFPAEDEELDLTNFQHDELSVRERNKLSAKPPR